MVDSVDQEASVEFGEYVAARGQALLRFAYVLCGDAEMAQDLVQSALTDAYRHWPRVSRAQHPDAYVRRIVVNAHLGWRRRRWSGEVVTDLHADRQVTKDFAADLVERDQWRRALAKLAPRARTVVVLRYYEDLSDQAIADLMGISVSGVRATASRALAALRTDLLAITTPAATTAGEPT